MTNGLTYSRGMTLRSNSLAKLTRLLVPTLMLVWTRCTPQLLGIAGHVLDQHVISETNII